jgi:hypothetical protein
MTSIEGVRQQRTQQVDGTIDSEIKTFSQDKTNEFFLDVKNDMADLMQMSAERGKSLTLKQAYDKAVSMNEEVQSVISKRKAESVAAAKKAGSSLPARGAPPAAPASKGDDLRGDLLSAFETLANQ